MKEYMLLIKNPGDYKSTFPAELHHEFLKKCEAYIAELKKEGKLISAQPLVIDGVIISGSHGSFNEEPVDQDNQIQVGYYHILANSMDEAIAIAKKNPEFEYGTTTTIEVRPIKMRETSTGFVYPNHPDSKAQKHV